MENFTPLKTPLGTINITVNGEVFPYEIKKLNTVSAHGVKLLGHYQLSVPLPEAKLLHMIHIINCRLQSSTPLMRAIENDELLATVGLYSPDHIKLSIGVLDMSDDFDDCLAAGYPEVYHLEDGIEIATSEYPEMETYTFFIAWLDDIDYWDIDTSRDVETFFGADWQDVDYYRESEHKIDHH
ncbi:hypothetical protein [Aerococcus vaginalis]